MRTWFKTALVVLVIQVAPPVSAAIDFESIAELTPGEQYRQLSLLLLVAGGTEQGLLDLLRPIEEQNDANASPAKSGPGLTLDDYVTPLTRIVDQETMLAGAAAMFHFARENNPEIQSRLNAITRVNPILVSMIDINEIAADAIIIRNSIADSMEYSELIDNPGLQTRVRAFRAQTVYLRNMMEYNRFQEELARITDDAIVDLGGRLDAYQRMFEDEIDVGMIERRVESAEIMNAQTGGRFDEQANMRTSELLMMLIMMESQVR